MTVCQCVYIIYKSQVPGGGGVGYGRRMCRANGRRRGGGGLRVAKLNINNNNNNNNNIICWWEYNILLSLLSGASVWVDCYGARVRAAVIGQQQAAALRDNEPTTTDDGDGHCRRSYSSARSRSPLFIHFPYRHAGQACVRTYIHINTQTHTIRAQWGGGNQPRDTFRRRRFSVKFKIGGERGRRRGGRWPSANGAVAWTTRRAPQRS